MASTAERFDIPVKYLNNRDRSESDGAKRVEFVVARDKEGFVLSREAIEFMAKQENPYAKRVLLQLDRDNKPDSEAASLCKECKSWRAECKRHMRCNNCAFKDQWSCHVREKYSGCPLLYPVSIHNDKSDDTHYIFTHRDDPTLINAVKTLDQAACHAKSDLQIISINVLPDEYYWKKYLENMNYAYDDREGVVVGTKDEVNALFWEPVIA